MKTETKIMKIIADYGKVLNGFGVKNPVFLLTDEAYDAMCNPDGREFDEESWIARYDLSEDLRNFPGAIGMYEGVFLVRAYNVNQDLTAKVPIVNYKKCVEDLEKFAKELTACTHELCSVFEATNEDSFGEKILSIINANKERLE
jgi:hypothetical protein